MGALERLQWARKPVLGEDRTELLFPRLWEKRTGSFMTDIRPLKVRHPMDAVGAVLADISAMFDDSLGGVVDGWIHSGSWDQPEVLFASLVSKCEEKGWLKEEE